MTQQEQPVARTQMLIRRPARDVFEAFVDPGITRRFWFTKGSGRLEPGARLTWEWSMYGVSIPVRVTALERDARIAIEWGDPPTPVEWRFDARPDGTTLVVITASGFGGAPDERVARALDSMGGFSFLLAGLKAYLEHGVELNLSLDHDPDARVEGA